MKKTLAFILMVALAITMVPATGQAAQATYILVVGVSENGGGTLGLCKVVGREYTLEVLPKAAQFAVLGDKPTAEQPLYKDIPIKDLVAQVEAAMGVKISRYVRVDDSAFMTVVDRLGGLLFEGETYSGEALVELLKEFDSGLHTRQLEQTEVAKLLMLQVLKPANWTKLPGVVGAIFTAVETNFTLLNVLDLLVFRPTKAEITNADVPAVLVDGKYLPQGLPMPILRSGRTLVPVRMVEEMADAVIDWNEALKQAAVNVGGKLIDRKSVV